VNIIGASTEVPREIEAGAREGGRGRAAAIPWFT